MGAYAVHQDEGRPERTLRTVRSEGGEAEVNGVQARRSVHVGRGLLVGDRETEGTIEPQGDAEISAGQERDHGLRIRVHAPRLAETPRRNGEPIREPRPVAMARCSPRCWYPLRVTHSLFL